MASPTWLQPGFGTSPVNWSNFNAVNQSKAQHYVASHPETTPWLNNNYTPAYHTPAPKAPTIYHDANGGVHYSQADANAANARIQASNTINFAYNDYINSGLNKILEQINQDASVNSKALQGRNASEKQSLQSKLDRTLTGLENTKTDVQNAKKTSLADVGRNYANQLQSGALSLSARGASDSSAFGQMGYGLAGAQAQARGDIFNQANNQFGQIGTQEAGAQSDFNQQNQLLKDWYDTESNNLLQKYGDMRTQIEREKAGANKERSLALANLNKAMAQGLASRLQNFQSAFTTMSKDLANSLATATPNIDPQAISQTYTPQAITRQQIPGLTFGGQQQTQAAQAYLPQNLKKDQNAIGG